MRYAPEPDDIYLTVSPFDGGVAAAGAPAQRARLHRLSFVHNTPRHGANDEQGHDARVAYQLLRPMAP